MKIGMPSLLYVVMLIIGISKVMAQTANPGPSAGTSPLHGLNNMNMPKDNRSPLPPPTANSKLGLDDALARLCVKLKEANANSDFCK